MPGAQIGVGILHESQRSQGRADLSHSDTAVTETQRVPGVVAGSNLHVREPSLDDVHGGAGRL